MDYFHGKNGRFFHFGTFEPYEQEEDFRGGSKWLNYYRLNFEGCQLWIQLSQIFLHQKTPKNISFTSPDPRSHYKNDTVEKGSSSFIFPKLFRLKN